MGGAHVDTDSLEALVADLTALRDHLRAGRERVAARAAALERSWHDVVFERYAARLEFELIGIARDVEPAVEAMMQGLRVLRRRAEAYLLTRPALGEPFRPSTRSGEVVRHADLLVARSGALLTVMSPGVLLASRIDWTCDDMHRHFNDSTHHGRLSTDYLRIASELPRVLQLVRSGVDAATFPEETLRSTYGAFFGHDPIRVERRADGGLSVVDGRHRLFAAMQIGADVPVVLVEV